MMDSSKYHIGYFPVDKKYNKWVERDHIEKPPVWCSVDMRDGNQSLVIPMSLEEKLEYYKRSDSPQRARPSMNFCAR